MELSIPEKSELRKMKTKELRGLASEIRSFLLQHVASTGGHLAPNLGITELTLALYMAFDFPKDKIIFDVGHQSYVYKILTGRSGRFDTLRQLDGLSGFPKISESEYDFFNTGHASNSISAGLGMAAARDLRHENFHVISLIGDGALSGGEAFEALNNVSQLHGKFIIILNDNEMSISKNVGGLRRYLTGLRAGETYNKVKMNVKDYLGKIPLIGHRMISGIQNTKDSLKEVLVPSGMLFENLGVTYLGPIDGHNIHEMLRVFEQAKKLNRPVLLHVKTRKGKGYKPAEQYPDRFHGVEPFQPVTGEPLNGADEKTYSGVFSDFMMRNAEDHPEILGITAAMTKNVGLQKFSEKYPERFFDVGIAEGHAVTFSAGLAKEKYHPYFAVFSAFLQRGYDQVVDDVCMMNLPVTFCIDRAGITGPDGETHQGIFDIAYLRPLPNMTVIAPSGGKETELALAYSLSYGAPLAIRYPRGKVFQDDDTHEEFIKGKARVLHKGSGIAVLSFGSMLPVARLLSEEFRKDGETPTLLDMRFVKPFDEEKIRELFRDHDRYVIMEDGVLAGGIGEEIENFILERKKDATVDKVGVPGLFVPQGTVAELREKLGMDGKSVYRRLKEKYERTS